MNLFNLAAALTLNADDYNKGLTDAEKSASSFGSRLKSGLGTAAKVGAAAITTVAAGATALGAAFTKNIAETAEYGDNIDKMSQKLGISAEAFQEWDFILQHSGSSIDAMKPAIKALSAAVESGSDAFEKLGMSQAEVAKMSSEQLFKKTVTALQGVENETERAALANKLFGKSGMELGALLNTTAEDTEAMREQVHELGGVMSDEAVKAAAAYQDSLQNLQTATDGLKRGFLEDFLPAVTTVMDGLTLIMSGDTEGGVGQITAGVDTIIDTLTEKVPEFVEIGLQIVEGLVSSITENLPKLIEKGADLILNGIIPGIIQHLPEIVVAAVQIVSQLAQSIGQALPTLIPAAVSMILEIIDTLTKPENVGMLIDGAIAIILGLAEGLIKSLPQLIERVPEIIINLVQAIIENAPKLLEAAWELIKMLVKGLGEGFQKIAEVGKQLVEGLWNGIKDAAGWVWGKIKEFAGGILDRLKNFFGIHSPSTVFRDMIGKNLVYGLGDGIERYGDYAVNAMDSVADDILDAAEIAPEFNGKWKAAQNGAETGEARAQYNITQNIYAEAMTPEQAFNASRDAWETAEFLGQASPALA